MIKEGLKMIIASTILGTLFVGVMLLSNFVNYGTFIFK